MHKLFQSLSFALDEMSGLPCWAVVAGKGTGSTLSIQLGEKLLRKKTLTNRQLSPELRTHHGQFVLFIQMAGWELFRLDEILCDSNSSNEPKGAMLLGLNSLVGKNIVCFELYDVDLGLVVRFTDDLTLRVYCDPEYPAENYSVFRPKHESLSV